MEGDSDCLIGDGSLVSLHGSTIFGVGGKDERFIRGHAGPQVPEICVSGREDVREGTGGGWARHEDEDVVSQDSGGGPVG